MIERAVQLVDRVRAKGVAHLRPVKRDAYGVEIPALLLAALVARALDCAMVGDVREWCGAKFGRVNVTPTIGVERRGYGGGKWRCSHGVKFKASCEKRAVSGLKPPKCL